MHDFSSALPRPRRIFQEALRRSDFPFEMVPVTVRVEVVGIQSRGGGQFHHPRGPIQITPGTMGSVENGIQCFAHETGHAIDALLLTEDHRAEIRELFGASPEAPWPDPTERTPYLERVYEAFAEAFSHAYFDLPVGVDRYTHRITPEVLRGVRRILTPDLPPEQPSELDGAKLVKMVVKWKDRHGSYTDVLVRPTTRRRLDFYLRNDIPLRSAVRRYKRMNADIRIVDAH